MKSITFGFPACAFSTASGGFGCIDVLLDDPRDCTVAVSIISASTGITPDAPSAVWNQSRTAGPKGIRGSSHLLGLRKYTGSVCKCVSNWGSELPQDLPQCLLELIVDHNMLVDTKIGVWKFGEVGNIITGIVLPVRGGSWGGIGSRGSS